LLSTPRGTEMFQFPRFPPLVLCVQTRVTPHDGCGVSPFGHPRIEARSAAPRGFSQPPTSFIGIRRQGIHRWLFIAWKSKDARARYGILKERTEATRAARWRGGSQLVRGGRSRRSGSRCLHKTKKQCAPSKQNRGWFRATRSARREARRPTTDETSRRLE
jgi:hypothetical protein